MKAKGGGGGGGGGGKCKKRDGEEGKKGEGKMEGIQQFANGVNQ